MIDKMVNCTAFIGKREWIWNGKSRRKGATVFTTGIVCSLQ